MEAHILFFILAGTLIVILVGYSVWSARREKSRIDIFAIRPASTPVGGHSALNTETVNKAKIQEEFRESPASGLENSDELNIQAQEIQDQVKGIKIKLDVPPEHTEEAGTEEDENNEIAVVASEPLSEATDKIQEEVIAAENKFITLYVVAAQGCQFYGSEVVQQLEALGLQYGEYQIFHRYLDNAGSPVLFSVANMIQPGIFDLNTIDNFATVGLVFFMQLPSPTNDLTNLRMMINTVERFAQALDGFVLDDQQQVFDEVARQAYFARLEVH